MKKKLEFFFFILDIPFNYLWIPLSYFITYNGSVHLNTSQNKLFTIKRSFMKRLLTNFYIFLLRQLFISMNSRTKYLLRFIKIKCEGVRLKYEI